MSDVTLDAAPGAAVTDRGAAGGFELNQRQIDVALRLSYAQAMLGAIFAASTGGMFLIGYALKLGAHDREIGLMSTIPMCCVLVQVAAAALAERGVSRRRMTIAGSLLNVACWGLIILMPYAAASAPPMTKVWLLIAIISVTAFCGQAVNNARGSWLGDLIPTRSRGRFFGQMTMFGGIIGVFFAVAEGRFLDKVSGHGIGAFGWLFGFGMLFGLANAVLFVPQADVPSSETAGTGSFAAQVGSALRSGPLLRLVAYIAIWAMQGIAGPFYATYALRDLGIPFLRLGMINAASTLATLLTAPFWGKVVDRYGCRPVLVVCTVACIPMPLGWAMVRSAHDAYRLLPWVQLAWGTAIGGVAVGISALVYNVTPEKGRSVRFAVISILVTLLAAPLPALGGRLPDWLARFGWGGGLRGTFCCASLAVLLASLASLFIRERGSRGTRDLVRNLPRHVLNPRSLDAVAPL